MKFTTIEIIGLAFAGLCFVIVAVLLLIRFGRSQMNPIIGGLTVQVPPDTITITGEKRRERDDDYEDQSRVRHYNN